MVRFFMAPVRELTIAIVFHNEERRLHAFLTSLKSCLPSDISFEMLFIDNCSEDSGGEIIENFCLENNWSFRLEKNDFNNMGAARAQVLRVAAKELVYFIDVDVILDTKSLEILLAQSMNDIGVSEICAWTGPLYTLNSNPFQGLIALLQKTWWGNFGSAQMRPSHLSIFIEHAPTAHLLIRKSAYQSVGSFDQRLGKSGEDLEVHRRLERAGFKIKWIQDARAFHAIADNWSIWIRKCFKYGFAQTQIFKVDARILLSKRCLPLLIGAIFLLSLLTFPLISLIGLVIYLGIIGLTAVSLQSKNAKSLFLLLLATHFFYFLGEVWGAVKPLQAEPSPTTSI